MEFLDELTYYYKSNYGCAVHRNAQCYAVADMLKRMTSDDLPNATMYFTHSTAIQQLLTALGALKDPKPITANNFDSFTQRKWRMSHVAPFAANVAVVKYDCPDGAKMKFFANERLVYLDWCKEDGICDWTRLNERYSDYVGNKCDSFYCKLHDIK